MTRRFRTCALAFGAALSLAVLVNPAFAQKYYDDEIVVTPPVYSNGVYGARDHERAEVIVSTRDLDLRRDADVYILNERIRDGAHLACNELNDAVRHGIDERACRTDARRNAMREARAMINYARG